MTFQEALDNLREISQENAAIHFIRLLAMAEQIEANRLELKKIGEVIETMTQAFESMAAYAKSEGDSAEEMSKLLKAFIGRN